MTAFVSGSADILICFHNAQQPIHLSVDQYERVVIGTEDFRPYVARASSAKLRDLFPGRPEHPLPLLMYSRGAYLARMFDLIIDSAPQRLVGHHVFESDMADVLRNMAVCGHGIAWLPRCTAEGAPEGSLVAIEAAGWTLPLSIVAYRDKHRRRVPVDRLWAALSSSPGRVSTVRG